MSPMKGLLATSETEADPMADLLARVAKLEEQLAGLLTEEAAEEYHGGDPTDGVVGKAT